MNQGYKCTIVTDLLLIRKNKKTKKEECLLYLKKRDKTYQLPGGHVEEGLDLENTIIKQTKEQVNLIIDKKDLEIKHIMYYCKGNKIYFVFQSNKFNGKINNNKPEEYDDIRWFELDNLPENMPIKLKKTMNEIKDNILYSEYIKLGG